MRSRSCGAGAARGARPQNQMCVARQGTTTPSICAARRPTRRTYAAHDDDLAPASGPPVDAEQLWQQLSLVKRQLAVAVAGEDFKRAAKLRDDSAVSGRDGESGGDERMRDVAKALRSGGWAQTKRNATPYTRTTPRRSSSSCRRCSSTSSTASRRCTRPARA